MKIGPTVPGPKVMAFRCVPRQPSDAMMYALLAELGHDDTEVAAMWDGWEQALDAAKDLDAGCAAPAGWQWVPLQPTQAILRGLLLLKDGYPIDPDELAWAERTWRQTLQVCPLPPVLGA